MLIQNDGHSSQEHHVCHHVTIQSHLLYGHTLYDSQHQIDLKHYVYMQGGVLKVSFCRVECELWDKRMTDTWAAGVFIYVLKQPEQLTKWGGAVTVCFSSSPLRRWTIAQNKSLIPSPWWSPSGGPRRSDINKKSQLTTLFAGLMSRCKVSHRSGVKAVMACEWVRERERKLEPWRIWRVYV